MEYIWSIITLSARFSKFYSQLLYVTPTPPLSSYNQIHISLSDFLRRPGVQALGITMWSFMWQSCVTCKFTFFPSSLMKKKKKKSGLGGEGLSNKSLEEKRGKNKMAH